MILCAVHIWREDLGWEADDIDGTTVTDSHAPPNSKYHFVAKPVFSKSDQADAGPV